MLADRACCCLKIQMCANVHVCINGTKRESRNKSTWSHLIFNKDAKVIQWKRKALSINGTATNRRLFILLHTIYKNYLKMDYKSIHKN